jgi:hypothetical protein
MKRSYPAHGPSIWHNRASAAPAASFSPPIRNVIPKWGCFLFGQRLHRPSILISKSSSVRRTICSRAPGDRAGLAAYLIAELKRTTRIVNGIHITCRFRLCFAMGPACHAAAELIYLRFVESELAGANGDPFAGAMLRIELRRDGVFVRCPFLRVIDGVFRKIGDSFCDQGS